jgi:hypothetical protein
MHEAVPAKSRIRKNLPARFARLARMTLIVIASASTTSAAKALATATTTASRTVGFWLGLIDRQRPSTQIRAVQGCNRLVGLSGIFHFNKSETPLATGVAVGDEGDLFDCAVRFENIA